MGFYYFDYTYFVFIIPALIISMVAQAKVSSTFRKYSQITNLRRITGAGAAEQVLRMNGVSSVGIQQIAGNLSDNFNPRTNFISLSDQVYGNATIAAVGVCLLYTSFNCYRSCTKIAGYDRKSEIVKYFLENW